MTILNRNMITELSHKRVTQPEYQRATGMLESVYNLSGNTGGAYMATLTAVAGTGKTTALEALKLKYPDRQIDIDGNLQQCIPVVVMNAEQQYTIRKLVDNLCTVTGMASTTSANSAYLTEKALQGLKNVQAVVLCLDECQEILNNSTPSGVKQVRAFIRSLADRVGIPIILSGTPGFEEFLDGEEATSRRVKRRGRMAPLPPPASEKTKFFKTTAAMLHHLEQVTGRRLSSGLDQLEFTQRLFLVTAGRMGGITDFFRHYIVSEIERESTKQTFGLEECRATMSILSSAFEIKTDRPAFQLPARALPKLMDKHLTIRLDA